MAGCIARHCGAHGGRYLRSLPVTCGRWLRVPLLTGGPFPFRFSEAGEVAKPERGAGRVSQDPAHACSSVDIGMRNARRPRRCGRQRQPYQRHHRICVCSRGSDEPCHGCHAPRERRSMSIAAPNFGHRMLCKETGYGGILMTGSPGEGRRGRENHDTVQGRSFRSAECRAQIEAHGCQR